MQATTANASKMAATLSMHSNNAAAAASAAHLADRSVLQAGHSRDGSLSVPIPVKDNEGLSGYQLHHCCCQ